MGLADAAAAYARHGWPVFPVRWDGSKAPLVAGGFKAATTDSGTISVWWKLWPDAWIGYPTGGPVGEHGGHLVVVDVDAKHGAAPDPAWPATRTARTASGGWHLHYVNYGPDLPSRADLFGRGVDCRAKGAYVVVPPSPGYYWEREGVVEELPTSLRDAAAAQRLASRPAGCFEPSVDYVGEGQRNDYLASFAGWYLRAYEAADQAELVAEVCEENRRICTPPVDDREAVAVARSIFRLAA